MLGQLRDRIQNAQHDLSASIRDKLLISSATKAEVRHRILGIPATSIPATLAPLTPTINPHATLDVNLAAGSELITHWQNQWAEMHQTGTENGVLARNLTADITEVSSHVVAIRNASSRLLNELLSSLPEVESSLTLVEAEMAKSMALFGALEEAITELEVEVQGRAFAARKEATEERLEEVVTRRTEDLKMLESQYVAREAAKLRAAAEREAQALQERQAVFQAAFEEELKRYKEKKVVSEVEDVDKKEEEKGDKSYQPISEDKDEENGDVVEAGLDVLADISLDVDKEEVDALESFLAE